MSYKTKTIDKITVGPDQEIHIRRVTEDGEAFCSIREFIPSTNTDGRGITFPESQYQALLELMSEVAPHFGAGPRNLVPGEGQGSLV